MYSLIEFNLISHVLLLKCHLSLHHSVFIFCRASFLPSFITNHVNLYMRVFWAIPWSRVINIIHQHPLPLSLSAAIGPAHKRLTPTDGDSLNPVTTKNWHPMWSLWLVAETQSSTAAAGPLPNGQLQSRTKIDLSRQNNSSERTTLAGWQTGRPKQCTLPSQVLQ